MCVSVSSIEVVYVIVLEHVAYVWAFVEGDAVGSAIVDLVVAQDIVIGAVLEAHGVCLAAVVIHYEPLKDPVVGPSEVDEGVATDVPQDDFLAGVGANSDRASGDTVADGTSFTVHVDLVHLIHPSGAGHVAPDTHCITWDKIVQVIGDSPPRAGPGTITIAASMVVHIPVAN